MLGRWGAAGGLSADRAWRWCVLRTVRDGRLARCRGRPVARHQLGRLFARRWHFVGEVIGGVDEGWFFERMRWGRDFIGKVAL